MEIKLMQATLSTVCKDARARHKRAVEWQQRWSWLWFLIGVIALALMLVAGIFFFSADVTKAALTAGGGIVSGVCTKFIQDQRKEAKKDADEAWDDVTGHCPDTVQNQVAAQHKKMVKIALLDH